jgi:cytochrome c-type biogenesis protein
MHTSFIAAFIAGVVSFFAPCVLPLLPAYVGYVAGVSLRDLEDKGLASYRNQLLVSSLFYILGFALVFTLLGTAAAGLGSYFRGYAREIQTIGGFLMIVFGLQFSGIIHINILGSEHKLRLPVWFGKAGYLRAFVLGVIFAVAWTPCIGAVLGSILALAAVAGTAKMGALLLFTYSLGISLPFLIVAVTLAQAPVYVKSISKYVGAISFVAGILLAGLGLLLVTGFYAEVNSWLLEKAYEMGWEVR